MHVVLGGTRQHQHCSCVLMLALQTSAALLLIGVIPRVNAGYMTRIVNVHQLINMSHTLKSSDNVIQNQVRETLFTEFSRSVSG